jgi:3-demethoxyubiquinol 3-hydroxylase
MIFDHMAFVSARPVSPLPTEPQLVQDLRSDHAGETGAVWIYQGARDAMRLAPQRFSEAAHAFVSEHLATEQAHLDLFDRLLDGGQKSRLIGLWKISGWALGFLPTLAGKIGAGASET